MFSRFTALAMCVVCGVAIVDRAHAQGTINPADILNQLQQKYQQGQASGTQYFPSPLDGGGAPSEGQVKTTRPRSVTPPSTIEREYTRRLGKPISQFGYDTFANATDTSGILFAAAADSYILGVGDEVVVTLRGQRSTSYRTRVDREGNVILPDLRPIAAAGRPFGQFREQLEAEASAAFLQTEVFVSLGVVREMGVLVTGEVRQPGLQRLSGLSTLVGALIAAGGPNRTGSLRAVQLIRDGGTETIDLYSLLLAGPSAADQTLRDGDRIVVPTLKNTVAIAGEVVRPGIYEITGKSLTQDEALRLAGGLVRPGGNRFLLFGLDAAGSEKVVESVGSTRISAGEVLRVARSTEARTQWFRVDGHVSLQDIRSLAATPSMAALLSDQQLVKDDAYMLFAVVQTADTETNSRRFEAVDPSRIRSGHHDYRLRERDTVIFISMADIRYLVSADVQAVLRMERPYYGLPKTKTSAPEGEAPSLEQVTAQRAVQRATLSTLPTQATSTELELARSRGDASQATAQAAEGAEDQGPLSATAAEQQRAREAQRALASCGGLRVLSAMVAAGNVSRLPPSSDSVRSVANVMACPEIYDRYPELLPFMLDYVTSLEGEVRRPGMYPVLPETPVATLINAGGGLTRQADLSQVEVSRYEAATAAVREVVDMKTSRAGVVVGPGDGVRVNPLETARELGTVMVNGEVTRPGTYSIRRGERLSELLIRAGGLSEYAYPIGAVFTRESVRQEEQKMYETTARELEASIPSVLAATGESRVSQSGAAVLQGLQAAAASVRSAKASGRVVTEADPTVLQLRPERDTILQPGDSIFVPKRPSHVSVVGEVLSPGAQQFMSGVTADEYIKMAGGMRDGAEASRAFVILPSGRAKPLSLSSWNFVETQIPPGSTIVVPRDVSPFNLWIAARDITQVLSQIAISAASLAVINR